jgi:hypothetical protein
MVFSKAFPICYGNPLISGGEINVTASQGSTTLRIKPGSSFTAAMPQQDTLVAGMGLFFGTPIKDVNQDTAVNIVNWNVIEDTTRFRTIVNRGDTIDIVSDSLTWANADKFLTTPNYQNFRVKVTGLTVSEQDYVYGAALYDNYNGTWPMYYYLPDSGRFNESHVPDIPVHFVVYVIQDGKFYGGITGATPVTGGVYTVSLTYYTDPKTFKALVAAL